MRVAITSHIKYIFLDIVGYTRNRSVEAQQDIISKLNEIVKECIKNSKIPEGKVIFLPTGDGICIALLVSESQYDIHLKIALDILKLIQEYNNETNDEMRRFLVRIGINSNVDNIIEDINGEKNVAGAGINIAQRVMNLADGNQILVGQQVYETLRYREEYLDVFRGFPAKVKHGQKLDVYQFIKKGYLGLNINIPSAFEEHKKVEPKLTKHAAYYFAHAIKNKDLLENKLKDGRFYSYAANILLWFLALDSIGEKEATILDPYDMPRTYRLGVLNFNQQIEYYSSIDHWVRCELSSFIDSNLSTYAKYFDFGGSSSGCIFIKTEGKEKLKNEWPDIWKEFDLDKYD